MRASTDVQTAHAESPVRRRTRLADNEAWLGRAMLAPAIIYIVALVGVPFLLALFYSVTNISVGHTEVRFVGLENFISALQNPTFLRALKNSFLFAFFSQVLVIVLATILASALQKDFPGKWLVRLLILLPWVAPISLGSIGWLWIFEPIYSVINWTLRAIHVFGPNTWPIWLGQPNLAFASVVTVHVWRLLPLATVITLGGFSSIPQDLLDAASVDGAGFWRRQFQITLPLVLPIMLVALLFGVIFAFTDMIVIYVLTRGGPYDMTQVLASLAFFTGIEGGDLAGGAAIALFLFPLLAASAIFAAFPFAWMLITTFKQTNDLLDPNHNPFVYHQPPTLEHLRILFFDTLFGRWVANTLFVGTSVVIITLALAIPAGYSLARLSGKFGEKLGIAIFLTYLVPSTILFIPLSRVVAILHLQDSLLSLVLVYPSFTVPFCTWLLMGFFKVIPKDLEEAAMIDGLSRFGAFLRVIMPMSVAGVLTVIIFSFTLVTQEFVYGLTFITAASNLTLSVGVPTFLVRGDVYFWGSLMGACFIASVPVAILYNLFVDRFISGFTVGSVKG